jgi:hypothetical protein
MAGILEQTYATEKLNRINGPRSVPQVLNGVEKLPPRRSDDRPDRIRIEKVQRLQGAI